MISEKLTGLMNAVRSVTGGDGKLSVDDATKLISNLIGFKDYGVDVNHSINDLTTPGVYSIQNQTTDSPHNNPWGLLVVLTSKKADEHYVLQIFIESSYNSKINFRLGIKANKDAAVDWKAWNTLGAIRHSLSVLLGGVQHEYC